MRDSAHRSAGLATIALLGALATVGPVRAEAPCIDCLSVRVGPPTTVRGPFPDELDAAFTAIRLPDGSFRGFSANGATYAIDGRSLMDLGGPRRAVMQPGAAGSLNECGSWLTTAMRSGDQLLGFVHQERICDYGPDGQTDKSMAMAVSRDDGLTWTDLGTVITGTDKPQRSVTTGEGDCSLVDGLDGFLYAYCLRNSDWQTIVARAPADDPTNWLKYHEGSFSEPGLGGAATDIGFVGTGAGYLEDFGLVAAIATDPWFGGLRLSLSEDKVTFADLDEPLLPIDGSDWNRPADTDLMSYATIIDPDTGSNAVSGPFLLSYIYVPPGKGFESRYLVLHEMTLAVEETPQAVQVGLALTRWRAPDDEGYATSTGPMTEGRIDYEQDKLVAYMLTRPPEEAASIKFAECARGRDQILADDGSCDALGYERERTAGWLYAAEQPGTVPVYRCAGEQPDVHFASGAADCEGLGTREFLLGYGLAP